MQYRVTSHLSPVRGAKWGVAVQGDFASVTRAGVERGFAVQFAASSFHTGGVTSHLSPVRGAARGVAVQSAA